MPLRFMGNALASSWKSSAMLITSVRTRLTARCGFTPMYLRPRSVVAAIGLFPSRTLARKWCLFDGRQGRALSASRAFIAYGWTATPHCPRASSSEDWTGCPPERGRPSVPCWNSFAPNCRPGAGRSLPTNVGGYWHCYCPASCPPWMRLAAMSASD